MLLFSGIRERTKQMKTAYISNPLSHHSPEDDYCTLMQTLPVNRAADMLQYGKSKPDVISLAQGEGDKTTPDFIIDAAMNAARDGQTFYSPPLGLPILRHAISDYYRDIYNCTLPSQRIFVTASGTNAVHLTLHSILEDGDEVVAITPIWKNLLGAIAVARGQVKEVPLTCNDQEWSLDMDRVFDAVTEKTKAIMLVTPSNPTGWMMQEDEIKQIIAFARSKNIWIIADEVYGRIVFDGKHAPSFLHHIDDYDKVFVINSFSKAWSMTGWRLGWIVGPKSAESKIRDLALYDNMGPASFPQFGALAALEHGESFLLENLTLWKRNRDKLLELLAPLQTVSCPNPQATFYGFFQVKNQPDCYQFTKQLIDECGVSLAPGHSFGKDFKGWLRICYALSEELMDEALNRLEKGLKGQ